MVLTDLENAGLVLNAEKSHLEPQQGLVLSWTCMGKGLFKVPTDKISKLTTRISTVGKVSVRQLASVVGQIISMGIAIGPISRLRSRYLCDVINHRFSWHDKVRRLRMSCSSGKLLSGIKA